MKVALLTASVVAILLFCLLPIRYVYTVPHPFVCNTTECPMDLIGKNGQSVIPVIAQTPLIIALYKTTFDTYNGYPHLWSQHPVHDYAFIAIVGWLLAYEAVDKYNAFKRQDKTNGIVKKKVRS